MKVAGSGEWLMLPTVTKAVALMLPKLDAPGGAGGGGASPRRPAASRELGDVVICAEYTTDLREAAVHGALHLLGMDHERDRGEMMALQRELLSGERP